MAFDVIVVGGGLVGASFALALEPRLRVAVIEATPEVTPEATLAQPDPDAWDARVLAVSPASRALLDSIGVWARLDPHRIGVCRAMQVHGDHPGARLEFSAYDAGVEVLAWMVESRALLAAMRACIETASNVVMIAPARCAALATEGPACTLRLQSGEMLQSALVVGADGAKSWVRAAVVIEAATFDFEQTGVIANFEAEHAHHGDAFQGFLPGGEVLAFLPLPGRRVSIVWSARTEHARALVALAPEALATEAERASGGRLGRLMPLGAARGLPLRAVSAVRMFAERVALIGDAAHVVHPLAGQGVNLGFGDAQYLALTLNRREEYRDCGDARLLRRFQRARAEDILAMRTVTRGLHGLFGLAGPIPQWLRNTGLNLTDRLPVIKTILARRALG